MRLVDVQRHTVDSLEFLDHAKSDLFPDEIFVFTPKGKIIDLRQNATALDFAYAIHTDVGNHTAKALVDKLEVPLSTRLANGQTVKIVTDPAVTAATAMAGIRGHRARPDGDPALPQEPAPGGHRDPGHAIA